MMRHQIIECLVWPMSECAEIDQPIKVLSAYVHVTRGYIDFVKKKELFA